MEKGAFTLVEDSENQAKWLHHGKEIKDTFIAFNAKFLGSVEVSQPKGVDMVKDSIKKLKIARQLKKADAGHKASKLVKVEIIISIDCIKVVEVKNKNMICARPLQRVSYCADDHRDKRLFAFIAKEQETKCHKCFVFVSEKEASEITLTLGQAFQLAYKRYLEKEKTEKKESATESAINVEKENTLLKEENVRLKQELETNKSKDESVNVGGDTSYVSNISVDSNTPMKSSLPSASFGFISVSDSPQSPIDMNDISFISGFEKSDNDFDPRKTNNHFNEANSNMLNMFTGNDTNKSMFGTCGSPREEDFIVKQDPFADTPDWSSAASVCSEGVTRQHSVPEQFVNGNIPSNVVNGHCGNPFANSLGTTDINNKDFNLNKSFNDPNSDLFTQYLSNVVAQRTSSDASLNGISSSNESYNNSSNSVDHFNIDDQFTANNEFGFHKLNLTDASGNTINEFNETDDGFFTDVNFVQRPKAHTITVLTADEQKFHNFSPSALSNDITLTTGDQVSGSNEGGLFPDDTFERPKAQSVGPSYKQVVRPRPTSLAVQSQVLPAPPSKQSIKKPSSLLIKTPTQKMLTSTPLKEEPAKVVVEEKYQTKPRSASYILPNVKNTIPAPEMRARSRSRHVPLNRAPPLKESISRASKSLEDLCCIDSPTSSKSLSPKSTPGSRAPTNPFTATTPQF